MQCRVPVSFVCQVTSSYTLLSALVFPLLLWLRRVLHEEGLEFAWFCRRNRASSACFPFPDLFSNELESWKPGNFGSLAASPAPRTCIAREGQ